MKLKSHSGAKKRVKINGNKKKFMQKSCRSHLLMQKSRRQKDLHDKGMPVDPTNLKKLARLLPYS